MLLPATLASCALNLTPLLYFLSVCLLFALGVFFLAHWLNSYFSASGVCVVGCLRGFPPCFCPLCSSVPVPIYYYYLFYYYYY